MIFEKNIVGILVDASGRILMDDQPTQIDRIKSTAEKKIASNPNIIFSVVTHKNTKFDDYILVLDQLKQANATKISIANPPSF